MEEKNQVALDKPAAEKVAKPVETKAVAQTPAKQSKPVRERTVREEEIFDAAGAVVGRLAALVVKRLLAGKRVVILNAEKAVISGDPKGVVERYRLKRGMQNKSDPEHSPKWPRRPDFLYKKIFSGMFPRKPRGKSAFKNLRIHIGVPSEYAGKKAQQYAVKTGFAKSITLGQICANLGWQHEKVTAA